MHPCASSSGRASAAVHGFFLGEKNTKISSHGVNLPTIHDIVLEIYPGRERVHPGAGGRQSFLPGLPTVSGATNTHRRRRCRRRGWTPRSCAPERPAVKVRYQLIPAQYKVCMSHYKVSINLQKARWPTGGAGQHSNCDGTFSAALLGKGTQLHTIRNIYISKLFRKNS